MSIVHKETNILKSFAYCLCCFVVSIFRTACVPKAECAHLPLVLVVLLYTGRLRISVSVRF